MWAAKNEITGTIYAKFNSIIECSDMYEKLYTTLKLEVHNHER